MQSPRRIILVLGRETVLVNHLCAATKRIVGVIEETSVGVRDSFQPIAVSHQVVGVRGDFVIVGYRFQVATRVVVERDEGVVGKRLLRDLSKRIVGIG